MVKRTISRLLGSVLAGWSLAACSTGPIPAAQALPDDQMVFTVQASGGMVPPALYAMQSPSLVVYGDGRILQAVKQPALQLIPPRYELARIDAETVADFVAATQSGGLISSATDFGKPRMTDLDTTTVTVHGDSEPAQVRVYALSEQFESGLTDEQRAARDRLRTLLEQAAGLSAGADTSPYIPDRVVVYETPSRPGDGPPTATWPGPPPESFLVASRARRSTACGGLSGAEAATVYAAALTNPGARWLVDGNERVLAVNPLPLPGDCP